MRRDSWRSVPTMCRPPAAQERERQAALARRLQMQHAAAQSALSSEAEPMGPEAMAGLGPGAGPAPAAGPTAEPVTTVVRDGRKVGRNEPCPCGSGKKYKHCHGALAREA